MSNAVAKTYVADTQILSLLMVLPLVLRTPLANMKETEAIPKPIPFKYITYAEKSYFNGIYSSDSY